MSNKKEIQKLTEQLKEHINSFVDVINSLTDEEKLKLYREYAEANCYELPNPMEDINDYLSGDFVEDYRKIDHENFDSYDECFWFDGYSYIHSGSYADWVKEFADMDAVADWIADRDYCCDNDDLFSDWLEAKQEIEATIEDFKNI